MGEFRDNLATDEKTFYKRIGLKVLHLEDRQADMNSSLLFCALGAVSRIFPTHYAKFEPLILIGNPLYEFVDERAILAIVQV